MHHFITIVLNNEQILTMWLRDTRNCIGVAFSICLALIISRGVLEAEYTTLANTEKDYGTDLLQLHCQIY